MQRKGCKDEVFHDRCNWYTLRQRRCSFQAIREDQKVSRLRSRLFHDINERESVAFQVLRWRRRMRGIRRLPQRRPITATPAYIPRQKKTSLQNRTGSPLLQQTPRPLLWWVPCHYIGDTSNRCVAIVWDWIFINYRLKFQLKATEKLVRKLLF